MTNVGDIVTVDDTNNADNKVPAIVTAVNDDGSVSLYVFGSSDVVEKRHAVTLPTNTPEFEEADAPDDDTTETPIATSGKRARPAATFSEGE